MKKGTKKDLDFNKTASAVTKKHTDGDLGALMNLERSKSSDPRR